MAAINASYSKLHDKEEIEGADNSTAASGMKVWIGHALILAVSVSCLTISIILLRLPSPQNWCRSTYCFGEQDSDILATPGFEHFTQRDTKFVGSFQADSPYRGSPSPEIDAAWERFTVNRKLLSFSSLGL